MGTAEPQDYVDVSFSDYAIYSVVLVDVDCLGNHGVDRFSPSDAPTLVNCQKGIYNAVGVANAPRQQIP